MFLRNFWKDQASAKDSLVDSIPVSLDIFNVESSECQLLGHSRVNASSEFLRSVECVIVKKQLCGLESSSDRKWDVWSESIHKDLVMRETQLIFEL